MGVFQSGQMGQTVNLLSFDFGGSNPSAPTHACAKAQCDSRRCRSSGAPKEGKRCESSSVDRALAFQAGGRGFESRLSLLMLL